MSTITKFSGPWHVITDSQGYDNIHHAPVDEGDTGDIVASCYQDRDHASLIAAAPELLDVASLVLEHFDGSRPAKMWMETERLCRAAVAKARGEG